MREEKNMLKVLRNLKKSFWAVCVIVLFLCIQAVADLALPDFTSKIVNTGIQAGGIENAAPEAIRKSQMESVLLFTDKDDEILNQYTLWSKNNLSSSDYDEYVEKYPELSNQDIYLQKDLSKEEQERLNTIMAEPMMIL